MTKLKRELIAGSSAGAIFASLAFALHFPTVVATLLAAGAYLGGRLLIKVKDDDHSATGGYPPERAAELIEIGLTHAKTMSELAKTIEEKNFRERIENLSEQLAQVFKHLQKDPRGLTEAEPFVASYLPQAISVIEAYIGLATHPHLTNQGERMRRTEETVRLIADAVLALHQRVFDVQVVDYEIKIETLRSILPHSTTVNDDGEGRGS